MDVEIKAMPALRCFCLRHVGPYDQIHETFQKLHAIAGPAGLAGRPGSMLVALYHDDPETTPAAQLRADAALAVTGSGRPPDRLVERRVPGGRYATTVFVGPYERVGEVWSRLMGKWLPASGERAATSPRYEIYRNTPEDTPPEKLVTELCVPLA